MAIRHRHRVRPNCHRSRIRQARRRRRRPGCVVAERCLRRQRCRARAVSGNRAPTRGRQVETTASSAQRLARPHSNLIRCPNAPTSSGRLRCRLQPAGLRQRSGRAHVTSRRLPSRAWPTHRRPQSQPPLRGRPPSTTMQPTHPYRRPSRYQPADLHSNSRRAGLSHPSHPSRPSRRSERRGAPFDHAPRRRWPPTAVPSAMRWRPPRSLQGWACRCRRTRVPASAPVPVAVLVLVPSVSFRA